MLDSIERVGDGIHVAMRGTITANELEEANARCIAELRRAPYRYQLFSLTDIDDVIVSLQSMRLIAVQDAIEFRAHGVERVAIVTTSDLIHGLVGSYTAFGADNPATTRIFTDHQTAEAWLTAVDAGNTSPDR